MLKIGIIAAALAVGHTAPALATRDVVPDNVGFAAAVERARTDAMHQPTFKTDRRCSLAHECATVEFAVRENGNGADFFIYPDKAPKDVIWCFVGTDVTNARFCQKAGTEPRTTVMWMEAYFPLAGEFREIDYGKVMDPDCKAFQHSQYDIDGDYVDCVARKLDGAPPHVEADKTAATANSVPAGCLNIASQTFPSLAAMRKARALCGR